MVCVPGQSLFLFGGGVHKILKKVLCPRPVLSCISVLSPFSELNPQNPAHHFVSLGSHCSCLVAQSTKSCTRFCVHCCDAWCQACTAALWSCCQLVANVTEQSRVSQDAEDTHPLRFCVGCSTVSAANLFLAGLPVTIAVEKTALGYVHVVFLQKNNNISIAKQCDLCFLQQMSFNVRNDGRNWNHLSEFPAR